ncbi:MAG: hypothetical protein ABH879_08700, partial [archaeon]
MVIFVLYVLTVLVYTEKSGGLVTGYSINNYISKGNYVIRDYEKDQYESSLCGDRALKVHLVAGNNEYTDTFEKNFSWNFLSFAFNIISDKAIQSIKLQLYEKDDDLWVYQSKGYTIGPGQTVIKIYYTNFTFVRSNKSRDWLFNNIDKYKITFWSDQKQDIYLDCMMYVKDYYNIPSLNNEVPYRDTKNAKLL